MEKVRIDDVASLAGPAAEKRKLTGALGTEGLALGHYVLEPGDSFAFGLHAHGAQEEVFHVQSGTVTFEVGRSPDETRTVEVGPGEVARFAPGEYQRGTNEGGERVVALVIGAPRESGDLDLRCDCPACGERTPNRIESDDDGAVVTICERCGAETARYG